MVTRALRSLGTATVASLTILSLASCDFEDPTAPGKKVVIVHAVLDLGASSQYVVVQYSDVAGQGPLIGGAQVSITTPQGVQMAGVPDTASHFFFDGRSYVSKIDTVRYRITPSTYGVSLAPGATYTLRVHTPAGDDVIGSTTVPLAQPVTADTTAVAFARLTDTLKMSWPEIAGAAAYEVRTGNFKFSTNRFFSGGSYVAFTTNPLTLAGTLHMLDDSPDDVFPAGVSMSVTISAVDANYYEYYRVLTDPFAGAAPGHLTGGMGVFGSLVPVAGRRLSVH